MLSQPLLQQGAGGHWAMSPKWAFQSEAGEDLGTPPRKGRQLHQLLDALGSSARPGASAVWSVFMGGRRAATWSGPMEGGEGVFTQAQFQGGFMAPSLAGPLSPPLTPSLNLRHLLMALGAQTCTQDRSPVVGLPALCAQGQGEKVSAYSTSNCLSLISLAPGTGSVSISRHDSLWLPLGCQKKKTTLK